MSETTWRLAPAEATEEMAVRAFQTVDLALAAVEMAPCDQYRYAYRASLSAAPKPPAGLYEVREDGSVRRVEVDVVEMLQSIITRAYSGRNDFDNFSGWKLGLILEEAKAAQVALTGGNRCEVCRQPVLMVRRCSECADCRALTGEER